MAPRMLLLFPALFISLIQSIPSHCVVVPTSPTLAISQATSTVCGITAGSQHRTIQCTRFPESETDPFQIHPTISFEAISGGPNFICGRTSGGNAFFCWDGIGQLIKPVYHGPSVLRQLSDVRASHAAAINGDGKKIQWWRYGCISNAEGCNHFPKSVSGEYHSLTSGDDFACALNGTDSVHCWGPGAEPIQTGFSGMNMSSLTAGGDRMCGLNKIGRLKCTGDLVNVPSGEDFEFRNLAIGSNQTCAISERNGSVVYWGQNGSYFSMGSTIFEFIVAGGDLTCGLTTDALNVACWGLNRTNSSAVVLRSLPKILPGVCMPDEIVCSCGVYPNSGDQCGGSAVICKKYTHSCQFSPPINDIGNKWGKLLTRLLGSIFAAILIGIVSVCVSSYLGCWLWCYICTLKVVILNLLRNLWHKICNFVERLLQFATLRN